MVLQLYASFFPGCSFSIATLARLLLTWTICFTSLSHCQVPSTNSATPDQGLFAPDNLVAWCIVPFDSMKRTPAERATMLAELGIRKLAYDYRPEHVASFETEILELKRQGIELTAWWFPSTLNDEARQILNLLKKHKLRPQLWVTGNAEPEDSSLPSLVHHLRKESERLRPIAEAAAEIGCQVGLYNHGGWFGEPENQILLIRELGLPNVGIVYNLHHGHAHLSRLESLFREIRPFLLCVNLNGMDWAGDLQQRKILPVGAGENDRSCMQALLRSGYRGPVGILNHTNWDAKLRLSDNLAGVEWLASQINGQNSSPPSFRTWPQGTATQRDDLLNLSPSETEHVDVWIKTAQQRGNASRGLTVFAGLKTSCFSCHELGSHGGKIGPSLTDLADARTPREIAAALLWPNQKIDHRYAITIVQKTDGTVYRGAVQALTADEVLLADPTTATTLSIPLIEIEESRKGMSLMPEGLMEALSSQQRLDLLKFLMETGSRQTISRADLDTVLEHAVSHRPQAFVYERAPLVPGNWPNWNNWVNRDRVYDFYTKQAEHFRQHSHASLLSPAPELDGGKYGHWGNQDEASWKGNEWNEMQLGTLQAGVFHGDGVIIKRALCVRIGDHSVCFNPDRLHYELVWKGGLKFSDIRHGFMDGLQQAGPTTDRPVFVDVAKDVQYLGCFRQGSNVVFRYRVGDSEFLDRPQIVDGKLIRDVVPVEPSQLERLQRGHPLQWPERFSTKIQMGHQSPFAIDTIELPVPNPWSSTLFGTGIGFDKAGQGYFATMTGEVWKVVVTPAKLENPASNRASWSKFADGLHQPLGVWVDEDGIFVMCRDQLVRLHDFNDDGEADYYECFANCFETSASGHDYICGLERDQLGRFYTASGNQGALQISQDGRSCRVLATGFRNPDGIGLFPDGTVTVPCSEGDWTPASMICAIRPDNSKQGIPFFGYRGPRGSDKPDLPFVYLPRLLDNSAGGQLHVPAGHWGPLENKLLHFSFGMASFFLVLKDEVRGQAQGAVIPLPGDFISGIHRGRFHPVDGHLYVCGMGGWGTYGSQLGCLQRVRWNLAAGQSLQIPTATKIHSNGVAITFSEPLDRDQILEQNRHFAQCWNFRYSGAYGSPELSARHLAQPGHDVLEIDGLHLLDNDRTIFLELPQLQPVNQLHVRLNVAEDQGFDLFLTVHELDEPRRDLPGYVEATKIINRHPIENDLISMAASQDNPWAKPLAHSRKLEIEAGPNLTFSQRILHAKVGESLEIRFRNPDAVPHNWVLVKPGSLERVGDQTNRFISDPNAFVRQYVPETEDVICFTNIVESGGTASIFFQAPLIPGRYPYLCTFPGHWMVMNGVLVVEK